MMQSASRRSSRDLVGTRIGLAVIHLGAFAVFLPNTFSWGALVVGLTLFYLTGAFGITLGFHRLLTHRSLKLVKPLEYAVAILGTLAFQGGPIDWISTHRAHHAHTDRAGDPHDVNRGLLWAHIQWMYRYNEARLTKAEQMRLAPDLARDRFYVFLDRTYVIWQVLLAIVLFAIGSWPWVIYGIFARLVATYHVTWLVNSAAHRFGYRTYRTGDKSTNSWWVAVLAWGEGWHNNHHAFPFSARHGLRWYEVDATWIAIRVLVALRLAREIKLPTAAMLDRLRLHPAIAPILEERKAA
jgi:stearoyl-CoA desaturase (delta-9 desaturase)